MVKQRIFFPVIPLITVCLGVASPQAVKFIVHKDVPVVQQQRKPTHFYRLYRANHQHLGCLEAELRVAGMQDLQVAHVPAKGLVRLSFTTPFFTDLLQSDLDQQLLSLCLSCPAVDKESSVFKKVSLSKANLKSGDAARVQLILQFEPRVVHVSAEELHHKNSVILRAQSNAVQKKALKDKGILMLA